RPNHVDDRITVTTPLAKPGAYLLKGTMDKGNVSRIIVWLSDTVIVKKQLDGKTFYYVADTVTGQPVGKANVEFVGWKQVQVQPNRNEFKVITTNFAEFTDKDGQLIVGQQQLPQDHNWLIVARKKEQQGLDRFAYLGFTNIWYGRIYDPEYNQ